MKNILFLIIASSLFLLNNKVLACSTTISGPSNACPNSQITYTASSTHTSSYWTWQATNCQVWDPAVSQWVSSFTHYAGSPYNTYSTVQVKMGSSGSSASLYYANTDGSGTGTDTHAITLSPPNTSAGSIGGPSTLQNCDNSDIRVTLLPANSWAYGTGWSVSSGLSIDASTTTYADISANSTTATGSQTVTANMKWVDEGNTSCGSKNINKSVTLTGNITANNISMDVSSSGTTSPNTICDSAYEGEEILTVSYGPGTADSWQWSFPTGWSYTSSSGSGNAYTITSAPSSGNVGIKATNECGTTSWKYFYINTVDCGGGMEMLMLSPNPTATESVTLSVEPTASVEATTSLESQDYSVDIYDDATLVKSKKKVKINDQIYTGDLKSGTYIFKVIGKKNYIDRQIIIK